MDPSVAAAIARRAHVGQTDCFGGRVIDHVARVARALPPNARSVAWLHDILERTTMNVEALRSVGLTSLEEGALDVLTRRDGEAYDTYSLRVAFASGDEGRLARIVKLADLDDHIASASPGLDTPPYAWARQHIANAQWRNHERVPRAVVPPTERGLLPVANAV